MTADEIDLRYFACLGLASEAGALALDQFNNHHGLGVSMKGAQDWLTQADGKVEAFLRERLRTLFPGDAVIGEEGGGENGRSVWIIDPIDGTANFARGDRNWCVSIGFLHHGEPQAGVIVAPALGEVYGARRGRGATMNGEPIRAARTAKIEQACVEFGWSTRVPLARYLAMLERGFSAGAAVKRTGSGALGICHVANGRTDAYAELHINAWDVAAALLIAREAGAATNDFFSGDAIARGAPILCCAPVLRDDLEAITGLRAQR